MSACAEAKKNSGGLARAFNAGRMQRLLRTAQRRIAAWPIPGLLRFIRRQTVLSATTGTTRSTATPATTSSMAAMDNDDLFGGDGNDTMQRRQRRRRAVRRRRQRRAHRRRGADELEGDAGADQLHRRRRGRRVRVLHRRTSIRARPLPLATRCWTSRAPAWPAATRSGCSVILLAAGVPRRGER